MRAKKPACPCPDLQRRIVDAAKSVVFCELIGDEDAMSKALTDFVGLAGYCIQEMRQRASGAGRPRTIPTNPKIRIHNPKGPMSHSMDWGVSHDRRRAVRLWAEHTPETWDLSMAPSDRS